MLIYRQFVAIMLAMYNSIIIIYLIHSGLPVPIVAIAAGIGNDHYGSELGLVQ